MSLDSILSQLQGIFEQPSTHYHGQNSGRNHGYIDVLVNDISGGELLKGGPSNGTTWLDTGYHHTLMGHCSLG